MAKKCSSRCLRRVGCAVLAAAGSSIGQVGAWQQSWVLGWVGAARLMYVAVSVAGWTSRRVPTRA